LKEKNQFIKTAIVKQLLGMIKDVLPTCPHSLVEFSTKPVKLAEILAVTTV
jgi:hypothetical protein